VQPGLVSPVLVGREAELAGLVSALASAVAGEPAVVLVGGEAGVGKTRLVEEAALRAAQSGARVLTGSCIELGGEGLPLSPLVDALRSLMRLMDSEELDAALGPARLELARLLPELDPRRPTTFGADGEGNPRLLELLLGVIQRLASDRPLMLVIEDLHWADRSTLDLVALLVRALRGARVLLVVTFRSDELHRSHPVRPLISGWERVRSVRRLELQRFSQEETAGQLEAILGAPPARSMLELLYERSEGNAFLVEEILGALQDGAGANELPVTLRDLLLARAERLSSSTLGLLRVAAAGGRSVPDRLLAAVSALDEPTLDGSVREAIEHHLLVVDETGQGYRFRHALTRDAIYSDALPRERGRIHRAYAEALSADPALAGTGVSVAAELARHWSAAHDLPRALVACVEAAGLAAAYAPAEASRHLEHALELWPGVPDAPERCGMDIVEVVRLAAGSAYAAGELDRSVALFDEALAELEAGEGDERTALVLAAKAAPLSDLNREQESNAAVERAVSLLSVGPPTVARASVLVELASRQMTAGDAEGFRASAEQALAAAQAANAREQEATARILLGVERAYGGDAEAGIAELKRGLQLAEALGEKALALRGYLNLSDSLEMLGRHAEAADVAARGMELAAQVGLTRHVYGGYLAANRAEALMSLGRWTDADRVLADATDSGFSPLVVLSALITMRGTIAALTGSYEDAARHIEAASEVMRSRQENQFALPFAFLRTLVAWGRGDLQQARDLVQRALETRPENFLERYLWPLIWLGLRIEAEAAEPQPDRTGALRALVAELPATTPSGRAYRALAVAAAAQAARAEVDWTDAVDAGRRAGEPYPLAYALLRRSQHALEAGDRDGAAGVLEEAARLAAQMGAVPLLTEAQRLGRRARLRLPDATETDHDAGPRAGMDLDSFGLTEREREVLGLVAAGRSNPQIAGELFISPKTASVHVSNIISKLDVSSRGEAAAVAHRLGLGTITAPRP
jgi:predicted ATPase/DNA-binding CsgD family transcriptional regulator